MTELRACEGEATITEDDFEKCAYCGMRVRNDLVDHWFFGFQSFACGDAAEPATVTRGQNDGR